MCFSSCWLRIIFHYFSFHLTLDSVGSGRYSDTIFEMLRGKKRAKCNLPMEYKSKKRRKKSFQVYKSRMSQRKIILQKPEIPNNSSEINVFTFTEMRTSLMQFCTVSISVDYLYGILSVFLLSFLCSFLSLLLCFCCCCFSLPSALISTCNEIKRKLL